MKSNGFAFISFKTREQVAEAIKNEKGLNFTIFPYNPKDPREIRKAINNIYIKNYPEGWDKEKIEEIFSKYGDIKSIGI